MKKCRNIVTGLSLAFFAFTASAQTAVTDYAGNYKLQDNPYVKSVKLTPKDGKLVMSAEGFPDSELAAGKKADEFLMESMGATITFERVNGQVSVIKIDAQGQVLAGQKEVTKSAGDEFAGSFKMSENEYVKKILIAAKEGKLFLSSDAGGGEPAELKPSKDADVFTATIQGYDADVIFSRTDGKVAAIKLSVAGGAVVLTGQRD
ncbi:hypothetical protein EWU23_10095 [Cytophagaceae bacterium 50C-KIRBA]|uniref:DUF3471 domain-containing protein n=1 Tax=Aquirufa beregesia TaxID=2516556 RepID=A0ABX0EZA2_9BACT|nr:hypothetical protein [Aquirufa beregesia]NGZ44827.1 hypothetical protein [Aquirufa beregesia]